MSKLEIKAPDFKKGEYIPVDSANHSATMIAPYVSLDTINIALKDRINSGCSNGEVSDGYHTFNELYDHRAKLFAALCNSVFKDAAWKSLHHHDPNEPMYDGMFIVGVETPYGQATYHYDIVPYWDMFQVKVVDAAPIFDGHTPAEAVNRILSYANDLANTHNSAHNMSDDVTPLSYILDIINTNDQLVLFNADSDHIVIMYREKNVADVKTDRATLSVPVSYRGALYKYRTSIRLSRNTPNGREDLGIYASVWDKESDDPNSRYRNDKYSYIKDLWINNFITSVISADESEE